MKSVRWSASPVPTLGIFHGHGASWRHKNATLQEHFVGGMCEYGGHSTPKEREKINEHANIEMGCVRVVSWENNHGEFGDRGVTDIRCGCRSGSGVDVGQIKAH